MVRSMVGVVCSPMPSTLEVDVAAKSLHVSLDSHPGTLPTVGRSEAGYACLPAPVGTSLASDSHAPAEPAGSCGSGATARHAVAPPTGASPPPAGRARAPPVAASSSSPGHRLSGSVPAAVIVSAGRGGRWR